MGCARLRGIAIPEGVFRIGGHAFADCAVLESIILPNSLEELGEDAFTGCTSLGQVLLPAAWRARKDALDRAGIPASARVYR